MPAFVASNATWNTTAGNKGVAPTPAVGELLVAFVAESGLTTGYALSDNQTGGTYTQIGSFALNNTSVDSIGVWVRDNLVASAVVHTINTTGATASTGGGLAVIRVSGMTRVSAAAVRTVAGVVQFAKQQNVAAGTPAPVFPAAALTANMVLGAVLTASNSTTNTAPPTGWTEQHDLGYNIPTTGLEVATRDSGETGTTITWTAATPSIFASIIIELEAGVPHAELIAAEPNYNGLGRVSAFLDDEDAEHYDYYGAQQTEGSTEAAIAGPPVGGGGPSDAELAAADPNYSGAPRIGATLDDVDDEPYDYYTGSVEIAAALARAPATGRFASTVLGYGPRAYWRLDESAGPTAFDAVEGHDGTWSGSPSGFSTKGLAAPDADTAVTFDGVDDFVDVPNHSGLRFDGAQPWSLMAIVNVPVGNSQIAPIIVGEFNGSTVPFELGFYDGAGAVQRPSVGFYDGVAWRIAIHASENMVLGVDHILVGTWDGTTLRIYQDSVEKATNTPGASPVSSTQRFLLGSRWDNAASPNKFVGVGDELAVFPIALAPADVYTLYSVAFEIPERIAQTSILEPTTDLEHDDFDYWSQDHAPSLDVSASIAGPPTAADDYIATTWAVPDHSDQPDEDEAFDFYGLFVDQPEGYIAGPPIAEPEIVALLGYEAMPAWQLDEYSTEGSEELSSVHGDPSAALFPPPVTNQPVDEGGVRWFTVNGINVSETGLRAPNGITDEVGRRVSLLSPETVTADDSYIATSSFLGEQDTAYQADVDDEHYNFYAQRLDGSVEAFIAGPPVVADDYVATAASVLPDRGWDEADYYPEPIVTEMVDGAEAVLGFLTVEDEIANAAQLDAAAGQDDDAWWTLTDPTDIAPFVEQAEAITGFLTIEDEIAEAAQLDRSVGQDDDQAWLAGDPTDVAPFIDGAEAILGFLTIEDEIAEAAQLPRDIGWFSEDFEQANDPTDIWPFLDEQEEYIAGPPLFADDGYIATVDVFDHSDEPAPDDAFDFYATTQEGTEWSIGFLAPDVEITIGAQPSRGEDTGLDNPDWDYTADQPYVEQTEAVIGFLAPDAEITEAAQLDRSVGQDDDQAWIVTDPTDVWPFTDQGEAVTAGPPTSDDFVALLAPHVESVAVDFPERIDDTEEQSVETAQIQPEENVADSTPADDPLYLAQLAPDLGWSPDDYPDFDPSIDAAALPTTEVVAWQFIGLRVWLDTTQIVGKLDGDPVSTWADQTGLGYNATAGAGQEPRYTAAGLNGLPVLVTDGVNDQMDIAGLILGANVPRTIYMVGYRAQAALPPGPPDMWAISSAAGVMDSTNAGYTWATSEAAGTPVIGSLDPRDAQLLTVRITDAATLDAWTMGLGPITIDPNDAAFGAINGLAIFHRPGNSGLGQFAMGEFRIYAGAHTDAERQVIETELLAKWFDVSDYEAAGQLGWAGLGWDVADYPEFDAAPDANATTDVSAFIVGPPSADDSYVATTALVPDASDQPAPDEAFDFYAYPVEASEWFIGFLAPDAEIADAAQDHTAGQDDDQLWTLTDPTDAAPFVDGIEYLTGFLVPADEIAQAAQPHYGDWQDWREAEQTEDYANDSTIGVEDTTNAPDTFDLTAAAQPDPSIGQDWHLWPDWDYTADQPYASELDVAPLTFPADPDEVTQAAQPTAIGQDDDALWTLTDPTDIASFTEQAEGFIAGPPDAFDRTIATQLGTDVGQDLDLLFPPDLSQLDTGYVEQAEGYVAGPPAFAPDAEAIASQPAETGIDVEGRWPEWEGTDATPFLDGAEWFIGFTVPDVEITIAAQPSRAEDTAIDNPDRIEWTEETDPATTLDLSPLVRADDPIEVTLATQLDASVGQDDDQFWTLLDPTDVTPFIDEQEEAIAGSTPADDPIYAAQAWPDVSTTEYAPEETTDYANDTALDLSALTPAPDSTDTTFAAQLDPSAGQDDDQGWIAADPTDIWPFTDQLEAFEEIVTPDEGIAATQDYSDAQYEPEALWAPESLSDGAVEFIASDIEQALLPAATALSEPATEPEDEAWPIYLALPDQSGEFAATQLDIALVAAFDVPASLADEPEAWHPEVALTDGVEQVAVDAEAAVTVAAQPTFEAYDWTTFEEPVADLSTIARRPTPEEPTARPEIIEIPALADPGVDLVALKDPGVTADALSDATVPVAAVVAEVETLDALADSEVDVP